MIVKLVAFGIAKDILKGGTIQMDLPESVKIGELKSRLTDLYPEFSKLRSLSFAVNDEYKSDDFNLNSGDEVIIIPPVSGG